MATGKPTVTDRSYKFDFVGKGKIWFIVSTVIILAGTVMFFVRGFNYGIDFLGGNLLEVKFKQEISVTELRKVMEETGYGKAILQSTASDQYIIRTVPITTQEKTRIIDSLDKKIGIIKPLVQDRNVAAGFSKQIIKYTLIAVAISIAGILIYVWIRFEVRFALVAIFEMLHDLFIVLSFYTITYREFNTTSIAVILTILGYSLNDGIVIFDRIREEIRINKKEKFSDLVNYSVNKTLARTLTTGTMTLFPIIVILIIGNETLKDFAVGLLIGIISGSYSSIFIGSPLIVAWNNRFQKYKK
ncbi:protein translocase subunit SecF [bacterium]|nr:protein translocase subunit SecF [bacterium]